jgi:hypothetical protein
VIGISAPSTHYYLDPAHTEETVPGFPAGVTQRLTVRLLPGLVRFEVILTGTMARPAADIRGGEASLRLPACNVSVPSSHCSVAAGRLGYGQSLIYSSHVQTSPDELRWEAGK